MVSVRKRNTECGVYIWEGLFSLVFTVFGIALHYEDFFFFFFSQKVNINKLGFKR